MEDILTGVEIVVSILLTDERVKLPLGLLQFYCPSPHFAGDIFSGIEILVSTLLTDLGLGLKIQWLLQCYYACLLFAVGIFSGVSVGNL